MSDLTKSRTARARWVDVTVIMPVHNAAETLEAVHAEIAKVLDGVKATWEIIIVDDGSTDGTREAARRLSDGATQTLILARRFGSTAALAAGLDHATGSMIITIGADGRSNPQEIPRMLALLGEGYEVVTPWRCSPEAGGPTARFRRRAANRMLKFLGGVKLHDLTCTFAAYDRKILEGERLCGEMAAYLPAIAAWKGAEVTEIKITDRPGDAGALEPERPCLMRLAFDMMVARMMLSCTARPVRIFGGAALLSAAVALGVAVAVFLAAIISGRAPWGLAAIVVAALLVVSVQLAALGLLGEMIVRCLLESGNVSHYYVKEKF